MQQAEVFHIYHHGEQRGPYSARQVNHLYRCGFIGDETLYWREGMEQWQAVTEIVERRIRRKRLTKWGIPVAVVAVIALLVLLFGSVTRDRWRELTSGEYTTESAWWRARGMIREKLPSDENVVFDPMHTAQIELVGKNTAVVVLAGQVTDDNGRTTHSSWRVEMQFDGDSRLWRTVANPPPVPEPPVAEAPATDSPKTAQAFPKAGGAESQAQ
jgi:hypothetical protein